jgi:hypothetical protein
MWNGGMGFTTDIPEPSSKMFSVIQRTGLDWLQMVLVSPSLWTWPPVQKENLA